MKQIWKTGLVAAFVAGSYATSAYGQDQIGMIVIKFSGERGWEASCSAHKGDGEIEQTNREGRGRRSTGSLTFRRVTGGSCDMNIPKGTGLKVDISGSKSIVCPFGDIDPCSRAFVGGESSFQFGVP